MTDESAFIRAIIADPDNDGPRLVYADWLEDRGQCARSELIRVQVELAEWGKTPRAYGNWFVDCRNRQDYAGTEHTCHTPPDYGRSLCDYHTLRYRERDLLDSNPQFGLPFAQLWGATKPYGTYGHSGCSQPVGMVVRWEWRRGFVEELTCSWGDWLLHWRALLAMTPLRTFYSLTQPIGYCPTTHDHPEWRRLRFDFSMAEGQGPVRYTSRARSRTAIIIDEAAGVDQAAWDALTPALTPVRHDSP